MRMESSYIRGVDKLGHPIIHIRACKHQSSIDRACLHKFVPTMLDDAVGRARASGRGGFVVILDVHDFGLANVDNDALRHILTVLSTNYPERLRQLYVVREGWLFWGVWKVVEAFIDPRTRRKIHFLGYEYTNQLLTDFDKDQLPERLGGADTFEYVYGA